MTETDGARGEEFAAIAEMSFERATAELKGVVEWPAPGDNAHSTGGTRGGEDALPSPYIGLRRNPPTGNVAHGPRRVDRAPTGGYLDDGHRARWPDRGHVFKAMRFSTSRHPEAFR